MWGGAPGSAPPAWYTALTPRQQMRAPSFNPGLNVPPPAIGSVNGGGRLAARFPGGQSSMLVNRSWRERQGLAPRQFGRLGIPNPGAVPFPTAGGTTPPPTVSPEQREALLSWLMRMFGNRIPGMMPGAGGTPNAGAA